MLVIFLSINLSALSESIFGSIHDESIHSLYTQVIIQKQSLTLTLEPFLPEGIIYPQASHVIFAYSAILLNLSVPDIILYVSVLFKALSILGTYFLGKKLSNSTNYALGLSFVTAFISSWPLNVTWGANPFLIGFPFFLICLGILFSLYRKTDKTSLFLASLMFGYTGAVILSYLEALITITCLIFFYKLIVYRKNIVGNIGKIASIIGLSIIPLSPFLYQFIKLYNYPGHNIGLPTDISNWTGQQTYLNQALDLAFNNLSPYLLTRILIILAIMGYLLLLLITKDYKKSNDNNLSISRFAAAILTSSLILSSISFLLPGDFNIISLAHQGIILSIPISLLFIAAYIKFIQFLREGKFKALSKISAKKPRAIILITIAVISIFTAPFIYYRLAVDSKTLQSTYQIYAITTQQDYDLIKWIKANLTNTNDLILVHPSSSGLFIPSISNNKIIYPFTASAMSKSYNTLVGLLENSTLNSNTYELLQKLNISYIFVSSQVVKTDSYSPKWEPNLFLGNSNFQVIKNFNDSYLFKIKNFNSTVNYLDTFENLNWDQNDWQNSNSISGQGKVVIENNSAFGSNALKLASQAISLARNYTNCIKREFFLNNQSSINLSFDMDATV